MRGKRSFDDELNSPISSASSVISHPVDNLTSHSNNSSVVKKSEKRLKLENEIFSKSIKDIEKMFNFSHINPKSKPKSNYINLSFLSDTNVKNRPPPIILPSSKPPVISPSNQLSFDFDDDGDIDLPSKINLERDLQLIDEMILSNHAIR